MIGMKIIIKKNDFRLKLIFFSIYGLHVYAKIWNLAAMTFIWEVLYVRCFCIWMYDVEFISNTITNISENRKIIFIFFNFKSYQIFKLWKLGCREIWYFQKLSQK